MNGWMKYFDMKITSIFVGYFTFWFKPEVQHFVKA